MQDYKHTRYHPPKRMGLMRGFIISMLWAAFMGFVVGIMVNFIATGNFLPK